MKTIRTTTYSSYPVNLPRKPMHMQPIYRSFFGDVKILFETMAAVFKRSGITDGENATALDYGDVLLKEGKVSKPKYDALQAYAKNLIEEHEGRR